MELLFESEFGTLKMIFSQPRPLQLSHLVTALLSSLIIDRQGREHNDFECLAANVGHVHHASQILRQVGIFSYKWQSLRWVLSSLASLKCLCHVSAQTAAHLGAIAF